MNHNSPHSTTISTTLTSATEGDLPQILWDSGAQCTSVNSLKALAAVRKILDRSLLVQGVNGTKERVELEGALSIFKVPGVAAIQPLPALFLPRSNCILVSMSQACKLLQAHVYLDEKVGYLWSQHRILAFAKCVNGLYVQQPYDPGITFQHLRQAMLDSLPPDNHEVQPSNTLLTLSSTAHLPLSLRRLKRIHDNCNHLAFSTLRKMFGLPPQSPDSPDPICEACPKAGMTSANHPKEASTGPNR